MANSHAEATAVLEEANSTATVSLRGLGLCCFNESGAFEAAFVRHPSHTYMIEIMQSETDSPTSRLRITGLDGDVEIRVFQPVHTGARRYEVGDFDRSSDTNDPRDFRWVLDIEGAEMHDEVLSRNEQPQRPQAEQQGTTPNLLSRLTIDSGTFYTQRISQETYARERVDDESVPPEFLGSIAEEVGAEIECADEEGSGLFITLRSGATTHELLLPRLPEVKYAITFSNDCPAPPEGAPPPDGTDFRLFYDVVRDSYGRQFDLALAVDPDDPRAAGGVALDTARPKVRDGHGLVCDLTNMGRSSRI